jgi:hypothetical protein
MPIRKYIRAEMRSAELDRLNIAYAWALRILELDERYDAVTETIAKEVIDVGTSGETDPQEIAEIAARRFLRI